jgi:hypothetical protein
VVRRGAPSPSPWVLPIPVLAPACRRALFSLSISLRCISRPILRSTRFRTESSSLSTAPLTFASRRRSRSSRAASCRRRASSCFCGWKAPQRRLPWIPRRGGRRGLPAQGLGQPSHTTCCAASCRRRASSSRFLTATQQNQVSIDSPTVVWYGARHPPRPAQRTFWASSFFCNASRRRRASSSRLCTAARPGRVRPCPCPCPRG